MRQGVLHYISRTPHKICKHGDGLGSTVYILCPSDGLMDPAESQTRTHSETKIVARQLLSTCLRSLSRHRMLDNTLPCCRQSRRHWKLPAIVSSRYHNSKISFTASRKVHVRICQTKLGVSSLSSGTVCPRTWMPTHQTTFRPISKCTPLFGPAHAMCCVTAVCRPENCQYQRRGLPAIQLASAMPIFARSCQTLSLV
jgi:hypothetical protein